MNEDGSVLVSVMYIHYSLEMQTQCTFPASQCLVPKRHPSPNLRVP
jgi:hypothetical protein